MLSNITLHYRAIEKWKHVKEANMFEIFWRKLIKIFSFYKIIDNFEKHIRVMIILQWNYFW